MQLVGNPEYPRFLIHRIRKDLTDQMRLRSKERIGAVKEKSLRGLILRRRSPCCGMKGMEFFFWYGSGAAGGSTLFARVLMKPFPELRVTDAVKLRDPALRADFSARVFQ